MPVSKRRKKPKARVREPKPLTDEQRRQAQIQGMAWMPANRAVRALRADEGQA